MEHEISRRRALVTLTAGIAASPFLARAAEAVNIPDGALVVAVCDPLAAPLSCACVEAYAQRDYDKLGKHLEGKLGRPVKVVYAETLTAAMKKAGGRADLVIGKDSAVRAEAKANKLAVTRIAALTGKDGATTQTGLIVVPADDPAVTADALKDYRILFGPTDADETHAAALALLKDLEVPVPATPETCMACSVGASKVLALHKEGVKAAAVISSSLQPVLEGCGTVKQGALRVIGKTDPVPFVAAFVTDRVSAGDRATITGALLGVGGQPALCAALESKAGFVDAAADAPKKK